jgi:hypothetical protein
MRHFFCHRLADDAALPPSEPPVNRPRDAGGVKHFCRARVADTVESEAERLRRINDAQRRRYGQPAIPRSSAPAPTPRTLSELAEFLRRHYAK